MPIVPPGGSSSGSAVAVAAGLAAAAIGTETSGSLLSPASQNGVVTVKPTVGLISRAGIIPIAHSQDTAGPLTRTVRDAAILLNVLAAADPLDAATRDLQRPADYTSVLDKDGLQGARIGVPSDPSDPGERRLLRPAAAARRRGHARGDRGARSGGAVMVRANIPTEGWIGGPGTEVADPQPQSGKPDHQPAGAAADRLLYELKHDLNAYLRDWANGTEMQTHGRHHRLQRRQCRPRPALRSGHLPRRRGDARRSQRARIRLGAADGPARLPHARARRLYGRPPARRGAVSRPRGAAIAAKAGYPSVQVPAGFVAGPATRRPPDYPFGATFTGRAWSEPVLLRLAYAFEQATQARRPPPGMPALSTDCEPAYNARTSE